MAYCPKCKINVQIVTSHESTSRIEKEVTDRYSTDEYGKNKMKIGYSETDREIVDVATTPRCSLCYWSIKYPSIQSEKEWDQLCRKNFDSWKTYRIAGLKDIIRKYDNDILEYENRKATGGFWRNLRKKIRPDSAFFLFLISGIFGFNLYRWTLFFHSGLILWINIVIILLAFFVAYNLSGLHTEEELDKVIKNLTRDKENNQKIMDRLNTTSYIGYNENGFVEP
jgi:hypothetical protein